MTQAITGTLFVCSPGNPAAISRLTPSAPSRPIPEPTSAKVLRRWLGQVLADRRARSALILDLSRKLHHLRGRIRQADAYLESLTAGAATSSSSSAPN